MRAATLGDATLDASSGEDWYWFPSIRTLADLCGVGFGGVQCAYHGDRFWNGNNQWSGWASFLSFFRHIAKLPLDYSKWEHFESACVHGGPMMMHEEFCIVSDRPRILKIDNQNRPHCDTGPFCQWSDGTALFAIRGVRMRRYVVLEPSRITLEKIGAETNAEIRRVMIERYGQARYLKDSGAKEIHRDDYGILYRKEIPGDEPLVMVKVVNATPEPDQSFKDYWLRVPPDMQRARQAVAWTFGKDENEYEPALES